MRGRVQVGKSRHAGAAARRARAAGVDRVLISLCAVFAASTVWILIGPAPAAVSWLSQTVINLVFVGLCWRLARRPTLSRVAARFWLAISVGGVLFASGTLLQAVQALR